jgi:hypothetical protein
MVEFDSGIDRLAKMINRLVHGVGREISLGSLFVCLLYRSQKHRFLLRAFDLAFKGLLVPEIMRVNDQSFE